MIIKKISRVLSIAVLSLLLLLSLNVFIIPAFAADMVTLKVYEGYRFTDRAVTKSGDKSADISFYVNMGRQNANAFALGVLGANKIKAFGKAKPSVAALVLQNINTWPHYANAPTPGYYVVQGADGKILYLIHVVSFKNQGKAASLWTLNFSWEKI